MKSFLKYIGPIMLIIGTILIGTYFFNNTPENTILIVAGIIMVSGLIVHVIINKYIQE